ncbi:MAG: translesion error-prone DNA polymerase V autoproteolytic subunit [Varibaculum sp.]|nr:translesion error-prone DNA polymerase V autoproteolytic subunit [Varibaculum sp.]
MFDKTVDAVAAGRVTAFAAARSGAPHFTLPCALEAVPAGWPSPAQDYFSADIDLNEHLIANPPATFLVRVSGDSMTGAGISDGDELIVDRSLEPREGSVVIAAVAGELTVKRLHWGKNGPELQPANPEYPILHPEELQVWGVVTRCLHRL